MAKHRNQRTCALYQSLGAMPRHACVHAPFRVYSLPLRAEERHSAAEGPVPFVFGPVGGPTRSRYHGWVGPASLVRNGVVSGGTSCIPCGPLEHGEVSGSHSGSIPESSTAHIVLIILQSHCVQPGRFKIPLMKPMARFWSKVDKDGPVPAHRPELGPCWVWTAGKHEQGYGIFSSRSYPMRAHRFSWELHYGPIPDGLFVCHHCDNPPCVNPEHLFTATHLGNMRDCIAKGRHYTHNHAKLSEELARYILSFSKDITAPAFKTNTELGLELGVSAPMISLIRNRKKYVHVKMIPGLAS